MRASVRRAWFFECLVKYFKIFSTDSKKCVIIEGFADRGEDDKTEDGLMAAERWWLSCPK